MLDLVEILQRAGPARGDFEPEFAEARLGEIERSCLDVSRARDVLGWEAKTSLSDGMRQTLDAAKVELAK